jgi:hypothetical protein
MGVYILFAFKNGVEFEIEAAMKSYIVKVDSFESWSFAKIVHQLTPYDLSRKLIAGFEYLGDIFSFCEAFHKL